MRLLPALIAVLVLGVCAPAGAATITVDGARSPMFDGWLDASLMPEPPGAIDLRLAPCPGGAEWASGCVSTKHGIVWLGPDARTRDRFLHEVGHLFDEASMSLSARRRFKALVGDNRPWFGDAAADPPVEKFAEAYSICGRFRTLNEMYFGMYDYSPTPAQHARVCALIREVGRTAAAARRRR